MRDGEPGPEAMLGTNEACFSCHMEMRGPFPYEHPATLDFSAEEGGCLSCHDPHGSFVPRLLRQPVASPHNPLCSQCHLVPGHNMNARHGTAWAGVACTECHADTHGSYTSRLFFTPDLEAQGCFAAGCHQE
jgi:predicted CXXCH cytochrome family protein